MSDKIKDFSRVFYPFLHGDKRAPGEFIAALKFSLLKKASESAQVKINFFAENQDRIVEASSTLAQAFHSGHKLMVCGNGGSATDAQHVAVEFMHPITVGRRALPSICLTNDMAMVTAVANDVGFDDVFVRQISALGQQGDVLLGISTSGNSENLLRAFETARRLKIITMAFSGNDGGEIARASRGGLVDFCFTVPTSSVHRIQETHVALYHILWDVVHEFLQRPEIFASADCVSYEVVSDEVR
ncbi:MAG: SIS domain-containing protein [Pyrinomonadaceae bacterium]